MAIREIKRRLGGIGLNAHKRGIHWLRFLSGQCPSKVHKCSRNLTASCGIEIWNRNLGGGTRNRIHLGNYDKYETMVKSHLNCEMDHFQSTDCIKIVLGWGWGGGGQICRMQFAGAGLSQAQKCYALNCCNFGDYISRTASSPFLTLAALFWTLASYQLSIHVKEVIYIVHTFQDQKFMLKSYKSGFTVLTGYLVGAMVNL